MSWYLDYLEEKDHPVAKRAQLSQVLAAIEKAPFNHDDLSQMVSAIARSLESHFHAGEGTPSKQGQTIESLYDTAIEITARFRRGERDEKK